ncbi:MAG: FAD-dependent oxidoreductase [Rhodospirillales bacterium]|nr:FAD-dependent oxidoreductase [Rhodospirillales bacterium]
MSAWLSGEVHRIKTDVAVIGGGTAGLNVAMAAREAGASVLIVDKAHIMRSGAIAGGIDHFMAYLDTGESWDTREAWLKYVGKVARGAADLRIHEKVFCDELPAALARVEKIGISLRQKDSGEIFRTQTLGQPGPYSINFDGKFLKPAMAKEVARRRCKVINRVQVTNLYLHDGELAGFAGWDMRTGDFYEVQAKAVVIATGNTNRMFKSQTGNPFNLWYCPANTGDLHRAAWDAGVELANVEYVRMTIVPKGFSAPGFNAFFGMGGKFVNGLGDAFMNTYHPMGDKAPRNVMVWGALQEVRAGRGPIYIDVRHLKPKDLEHLFFTLGIDKDTLPEFLHAKGYSREGTMIEMTISEPMQARPSEMCGAGIKIDETCASNIPGVFGAGDASDQMGCLHMCMAGGFAAGKHAARYALRQTRHRPLDAKVLTAERKRVFAPLTRRAGLHYGEFEGIVRIITTDHFGPIKTEISLTSGIAKLDQLDSHREELKASNLHELMRCHEAMNIHAMAKIVAHASLARPESRFSPYHHRADHPETKDEYCGLVVVGKGADGRPTTRFQPLHYAV